MKFLSVVLLLLGAIVLAQAGDVVDVDLEDINIDVDGDPQDLTGEYRWTSPEGLEMFVRWVADENGYRVVESNAVPVTADGVQAGGAQGDLDGDSNELKN